MRRPDILIRDKNRRSFKWWIDNGKKGSPEDAEMATQLESTVPVVFAMFYPEYSISDLEGMSFRDVQLKLSVIEKRLEIQNSTLPTSAPSMGTSIINTDLED